QEKEKEYGLYAKKILDFASSVGKQVNRLTHLVNDILDFGQILTGSYQLELKKHRVCDVIRDVVEKLDPVFSSFNIAPPDLECSDKAVVTLDKKRIQQVISNLLTNAI